MWNRIYNISLYHLNNKKIMLNVLIHLIGRKKSSIKRFLGKLLLYGGCKKVIERLLCFSPPTKCFYEDILTNVLHIIWSRPYDKTFSLF